MDKEILREGRIKAMQILYIMDLLNKEASEVKPFYEEINEFGKNLLDKYQLFQEKINGLIESSLEEYTINRLNYVDKAIVRLAVLELLLEVPKPVVLNEYIEITKVFTETDDFNSKAFNNKLLDKIAQIL